MLRKLIIISILLYSKFACAASFQPGDTHTIIFDDLSLSEPFQYNDNAVGIIISSSNYKTWEVSDQSIEVSFFEDSASSNPFSTLVFNSPVALGISILPGIYAPHWGDLNGKITFSILSGEFEIEKIKLFKNMSGNQYSQIFPLTAVPIPGAFSLIATCLLPLLGYKRMA